MQKVNRDWRVKLNPSRYNKNIGTKMDLDSDSEGPDELDEQGPQRAGLSSNSGYDANEQFDNDEDYGSGSVEDNS